MIEVEVAFYTMAAFDANPMTLTRYILVEQKRHPEARCAVLSVSESWTAIPQNPNNPHKAQFAIQSTIEHTKRDSHRLSL